MNDQIVLITGAGGFVGGRIVEMLHLSGCSGVRAGLRRWEKAARIARFPVEMVLCDILVPEQTKRAISGATHVVHCAVGDRDVIIQGTKSLLEAAWKQGVQRFIYLSSAVVYGDADGEIDESYPWRFTGNQYADAKIEAERLCWSFSQKGLPVVVLRPSIVYGPFSQHWTIEYSRRIQRGNWGTFGNQAEGICNLVYVDDLVAAILLALNHLSAVGQTFNVNGPDRLTWNQYLSKFASALGVSQIEEFHPVRVKTKTNAVALLRGMTNSVFKHYRDPIMKMYMRYRLVQTVLTPIKDLVNNTPTPGELSLYHRKAWYSTAKIKNLLGYTPLYDIETGLLFTVQWLIHHGFSAAKEVLTQANF